MPLGIGAPAPAFALRDQHRREIALADFADRHVLLVFYPWAFTGTCEGELTEIRDNLAEYQNDTVQVLTVSVDSIFAHKVWAEREGFDFPLLADFWPHGAVAQAYGVFNEQTGAANRGTFLVDPGGIIRFAEMNGPGEARDQAVWRKALAAR
jgi:mycoredoxin-dependent peroxiredoxin